MWMCQHCLSFFSVGVGGEARHSNDWNGKKVSEAYLFGYDVEAFAAGVPYAYESLHFFPFSIR